MNDITPLFFELIRVAIGNQACLLHSPSADEWGELYAMAKKQSLVGICFAGVQRLQGQLQCPPERLYLQWMGMAAKIQQRNEVVNRQCVELQSRLAADGYSSCILKGQGVALLYDESLRSLRQSGDIDIWLEGGRAKVKELAERMNATYKMTDHHIDIDFFENTSVEVHFTPGTLLLRNKNKRYQKWIDACAADQFAHTVDFAGARLYVPNLDFNLVFMLVHMHRHLFSEGLGLRQLMDYYFVLQNSFCRKDYVAETCRREILRDTVSGLGLQRFAEGIVWVLGRVFGLQMIQMPWTPNELNGRFLLEEVMRGGNFGQHDETYALTKDASHASRMVQKTFFNLRSWKYFPKESVWSSINYFYSFFNRYKKL